jgi:hypothetical protein
MTASNFTLKRLGNKNATVVEIPNAEILFSYSTPVAARIIDQDGAHYYKTEEHYSSTTTKHVNQFLPKPQEEFGVEVKPQSFFDSLVEVA